MSYRTTISGADRSPRSAPPPSTPAPGPQPVRLAVETNYLGADPVSRKQTFWGSTQAQLTTALAAVDAAEAGSPWYAGMAVHDRAGWRR